MTCPSPERGSLNMSYHMCSYGGTKHGLTQSVMLAMGAYTVSDTAHCSISELERRQTEKLFHSPFHY